MHVAVAGCSLLPGLQHSLDDVAIRAGHSTGTGFLLAYAARFCRWMVRTLAATLAPLISALSSLPRARRMR
eukprot:3936341-Pyramimonas_sp.AAC.1